MKTRLLLCINTLLVALMGMLGFSSCIGMRKYGVPYTDLEAHGTVTDTEKQPLENIQVQVKYHGWPISKAEYTNADGQYEIIEGEPDTPPDSVDIVATDTAGIYAPDSVRLSVTQNKVKERSKDEYYMGKVSLQHDFQLKKK